MRDDDDDFDDDRDDADRSPAGGPAATALRFVTPSTYLIAAGLFFLPWTDLSCTAPTGKMQVVVQSGYQSAAGEFSEGEAIADMRQQAADMGGDEKGLKFNDLNPKNVNGMNDGGGGKGKDGPDPAPILWVYLGLLAAGAAVPVLIGATKMRGIAVIVFAGAATAVLAVQTAIGLPLSKTAQEFNDEMAKEMREAKNAGGGPQLKMGGAMMPKMKCGYLPAYWGSYAALGAAELLGVVQLVMGVSRPPPRRRRRPRTDVEVDDEG